MTTPDDPPLPAIDQLIADMMRVAESERRETNDRLRDKILPGFKSLGVANIEVSYSGYGDDGSIDGIQYRDPTGNRVDRSLIPTSLVESLESCVYELLPAGFEINEGGQGTLTIDVQLAKVTLQHQENYTESRDSTREFTL
jgi:hypothetical protein